MAVKQLESNGLSAPRDGFQTLTAAERRILYLLASGMTRSEVARTLHLAAATVSHSMTSAKEKVGARTPIEAVVVLVKQGLL